MSLYFVYVIVVKVEIIIKYLVKHKTDINKNN